MARPDGEVVDRSAFDQLVGRFDNAMIVVTAAAGDERDGCLVGFHTQCSIDPPRYLVLLSVANRTTRLAARSTHLGVHALSADQHGVAVHFGSLTGDDVDKLAGLSWHPGPAGTPVLDECPNRFVGEIVSRFDAGDHVAHVLAPTVVELDDRELTPLRLGAVVDIEPGHEA